MLYHWHDLTKAGLRNYFNTVSAALSISAMTLEAMGKASGFPAAYSEMAQSMAASSEMMTRFTKHYPKPEFGLHETSIKGRQVQVTEETVLDKPYCTLKHFRRNTNRNDPKILLVAPMSGHHATLLRGTVEALLPHHEVYITDWRDASQVPKEQGTFGLEDYISYVQDFLHELGPETHVVAVCQPTVPVLAAISLMAANKDKNQPLSMTLMGGPVDTRAAETGVTRFAESKNIKWFANNLITKVPSWYAGTGQKVYPGFLQLLGFMSMNPERHIKSHMDLFNHLRKGDGESADKIKEFYNEYLAVCDLPAPFYLDTVEQVFQTHTLPRGQMGWKGQKVDTSKIEKTALFTVEGELDDISAPGQTTAAHLMCKGLRPDQHYNYLQKGAGHFGIFNGRRWREEIAPRIASFTRTIANRHGITYDTTDEQLIKPRRQTPEKQINICAPSVSRQHKLDR